METLVDLRLFREKLTKQIGSANWSDCVLSKEFKNAFRGFGQYRIESYYNFSAKVSSAKSICIVPNQWFFVAACCSQYHTELMNYKNKLVSLGITDEQFEACHPSSDSKISDDQKTPAALKAKAESFLASYTGNDKELLVSFLWDYDSWGGGKNIKRSNDFTESPVLNIANFINASSGLVGAIAKGLADNRDARDILMKSKEWQNIFNSQSSQTISDSLVGPIRANTNNEGRFRFMWELIKYFNQLDGLAKMSQGGLLRKAEKYYFIAQCAVAHKEDSIPSNHDYITLADGTILSDNFGVDNFFDAVEKFNAFYAGEYEIVTIKEDGREDLYYLKKCSKDHDNYVKYLTALRTKPFMLLAGISGTGKSRIVRELAFKSCTTTLHDQGGTTPGNYCMIEVKPNWHDSTELLGYYSNISKQYQFTKFVKFLVKAKMYPHVPFFVCLDEMNLAPVEQYFAEFLSILETRKKTDNGIMAGLLVPAEYFRALPNAEKGDGFIAKGFDPKVTSVPGDIFYGHDLITNGLTLPDNVFIIGTVNMDDTTHQFSRKVIDRAMTIEMNGGNLMDMFGGSKALEYAPYGEEWPLSQFQPKYVTADEVLEAHPEVAQQIQKDLPEKLDGINEALKGTPFQVSYRVLNEMVIYLGVLLEDGMDYAEAVSQAVDQIMLMKILPRIEGDRDLLTIGQDQSRLAMLEPYAYTKTTKDKLKEMQERLDSQEFTRFWP